MPTSKPFIPVAVSLLGASLLLSACGRPGPSAAGYAPGEFSRVAQGLARHEDQVEPQALARWIVKDQRDFTLVDLRPEPAYQAAHIDGAVRHTLAEVVSEGGLGELPRDRKVVLYSETSEEAAQAAVLLRLAGIDAQFLKGGYRRWDAQVVHPAIPPVPTAQDSPQVAEKRAIACYFLGGGKTSEASPAIEVKEHAQPPTEKAGETPPPLELPEHSEEQC